MQSFANPAVFQILCGVLGEKYMSKRFGPHREKRLFSACVSSNPEPGKYGDGNGLMLLVEPSGSKRWIQRLVIIGRRRDIGHGS